MTLLITVSEATVIPAGLSRIDSTVYSDSRLTEKSATQMYNLDYRPELGEGESLSDIRRPIHL